MGSSEEDGLASLDIPEAFSFTLSEGETKEVKGSEETLLITVNAIEKKKVTLLVKGADDEDEIYVDKVIEKKEKVSFNYHGAMYMLKIEDVNFKLFKENSAEISLEKGGGSMEH